MPDEYRDDVTAGAGGVMTDDVGTVTGELTVATRAVADGRAEVLVQYVGADEWYAMTGSPVAVPAGGLAALHDAVLARVRAGQEATAPGSTQS